MEVVIVLGLLGGVVWWYVRRQVAKDVAPPSQPAPLERTASSPQVQTRSRSGAIVADARWVPLGQLVSVGPNLIPGGVYVGTHLDAVSPYRGVEPALINPRLNAKAQRPDVGGQQMGYWPAYDQIPVASRAAYLQWLAAGRPAGAYIGYVFLFFYGIERRVILDASESDAAKAEVPGLLAEVERLLELYSDNGSFRGYATDFLATARLVHSTTSTSDMVPPRERVGWDIPLEVKLVVGTRSASGDPIEGEWALAWALTSPEIRHRTPVARCPEEFAELFLVRYQAQHGRGLTIKPNRTRLRLEYRPASASFSGAKVTLDAGDLPDVTRLAGPTKILTELVDAVTDDLDAFSRHVGRHDDRVSAGAVALLPPELARTRVPPALATFLTAIGPSLDSGEQAIVETPRLMKLLDASAGGARGSKREAVAVAALLAAQGIALEPDIRLGSTNFSHHDRVVLWREDDITAPPGDGFEAATVLLHLGVAVGASDGEVSAAEEEHLEASLENALGLPTAGRRRLRAHLRWLLAERPGTTGLKARLRMLETSQRVAIARFLIALAAVDGHISPKEIDVLKRLYRLLGFDPEAVHGDLHALAASSPVPVIPADRDTGDHHLPPAPAPVARGGVVLDRGRLAEVMSSTKQVSEVLTAVFVQEEADPVQPDESDTHDDVVIQDTVAGLDPTHSRFLRALATQPTWPRSEVEALADQAGLLAGGAIEALNDAAVTVADELLLEGHDPVELDPHVLKEMMDD